MEEGLQVFSEIKLKLVADWTDAGHADLAISFAMGLMLAKKRIDELRTAWAQEPIRFERVIV